MSNGMLMILCMLPIYQDSYYTYDEVPIVSEAELAEFWEKIEGEMNPESIWGDAKTDQEKCQAETL